MLTCSVKIGADELSTIKMFRVKQRSMSNIDRRTWMVCPKCREDIVYFDFPTTICKTCKTKLPLVEDMLLNVDVRQSYYKQKDTSKE